MTSYLIVVHANDPTFFQYTSFPAQPQNARTLGVHTNDTVSWLVLSASGHLIGYRVDFDKNGSPFANQHVVVPAGGISPPQTVTSITNNGCLYSITLTDLSMDDPQVVPYDDFFHSGDIERARALPPPIGVAVTAGENPVTTVNPLSASSAPGNLVYWSDDPKQPPLTYTVDFSGSGHGNPFVGNVPNKIPVSGGQTVALTVRVLNQGESPTFNYVVTVSGATAAQAVFTITA
jgi:hypothetical protein